MSDLQTPVTEIELAALCEATQPSESIHNIARRVAFQLDAANARVAELERIILDLCNSYECYTATHKPLCDWDEYDFLMLPKWKTAMEATGQ